MPVESGAGQYDYAETARRRQQQQQQQVQQQPTYYWFRGIRYSSRDAYLQAVARYQQTQLQRQRYLATRQALFRAQRQRARRLLADQRQEQALAAAELERKRALALLRLQREADLKQRRKTAYEELMRRTEALRRRGKLLAEQRRAELQAAYVRNAKQEQRALEMEKRDALELRGGFLVGNDVGESVAQRRNRTLLTEAEESGEYEKIFQYIRDANKKTGGRYLDQKLYDNAMAGYQQKLSDLSLKLKDAEKRIRELYAKGDYRAALKEMQSEDYQALEESYYDLVGRGRQKGELERVAALTQQIGEQRDAYLERVFLGMFANGGRDILTESQLAAARERVFDELGIGPGAQDTPRARMKLRKWMEHQYDLREAEAEEWAKLSVAERYERMGLKFNRLIGWHIQDEDGRNWVLKPGHTPFEDGADAFEPVGMQLARRQLIPILGTAGVERIEALREKLGGSSYLETAAAQKELIQLIEDGVDSWIDRMAPDRSGSQRYGNPERRKYLNAREGMITRFLGLFGVERPGGIVGAFDKLNRAPVTSQLFGGLDFLWANVNAYMFEQRLAKGGEDEAFGTTLFPNIGFDFGGENPDGSKREGGLRLSHELPDGREVPIGAPWNAIGFSDLNKEEVRAVYEEYRSVIENPSSTDGERLDAMRALLNVSRTGNTMLLADILTDPLTWLPIARFTRAGSLALGEAGGFRAALSQLRPDKALRFEMPKLAPFARDFGRFMTPDWIGDFGPQRTALKVSQEPARRLGVLPSKWRALPKEDRIEMLKRLAKGQPIAEIRRDMPAVERLFKGKTPNTQQLMAFAQEAILRSVRSHVSPEDLRATITQALREQELAEAEIRAQASIEAANAAREVGGAALAKIRTEMQRKGLGTAPPVAVPKPVTAAQSRKLNRLKAAWITQMSAHLDVARRAAKVADSLQAHDSLDTAIRHGEWHDLEDAMRELEPFQDTVTFKPNGSEIRQPGLVTKARDDLANYRRSIGLEAVERPSYGTWFETRWLEDSKFIGKQLAHARQMRAAAKTAAQRAYWEKRISKLYAAQEGLRVERELAQQGTGFSRRTLQKHGDEAVEYMNPNRVAHVALTEDGWKEEVLRELHVRAQTREVVQPFTRFSMAEAIKIEHDLDVMYTTPVKRARWDLNELLDESGAQSLGEIYDVLRSQAMRPGGAEFYQDAFEEVAKQARAVGVDSRFASFLDEGHIDHGDVLSLGEYLKVDQEIRAGVRAVTGAQRKGATRVARPSGAKELGLSVLNDIDPRVVAVKSRILRRHGLTVQQYDEMRTTFGDITRRGNTTRSFYRKAAKMPGDLATNIKRLREARRRKEVFHDLEEYGNRPDRLGLTDEELYSLWKAEHNMDDLRPSVHQMTEYQAKLLEHGFADFAGFAMSERHLVERLLGGRSVAPPGTRLVRKGEFGGLFDDARIPVFVVAKGDNGTRLGANLGMSVSDEGIFLREGVGQVTVYHELFHQMFDDAVNAQMRQPFLDWFDSISAGERARLEGLFGRPPLLPGVTNARSEMLAEMYGWWKAGSTKWANAFYGTDKAERFALEILESMFERVGDVTSTFGFGRNHPPLGNRAAMRRWLVDNGFWSPKTGEDIKRGARVWSIEDERAFWEAHYAYTPPWTDPEQLIPLLDDPTEYFAKFREWGFFDDDFEVIAAAQGLKPVDRGTQLAFGVDGVKEARSWQEMRAWFEARYGELVAKDGRFHAVPWVMSFDEYDEWIGQQFMKVGGDPSLAGTIMDPTLLTPAERDKLMELLRAETRRHLARVKKAMDEQGLDPELWLPEEVKRLAYDIVDGLLRDKAWMRKLDAVGLGERLQLVGQIQRLFIVWQPAFPIMNALDAYGPKAIALSIMRNRGRPIYALKPHWRDLVPSLDEVGDTLTPTWGIKDMKPWTKIGDEMYDLSEWMGAFGDTVVNFPLRASAKIEGRLRLAFARSVAGRTYDDLLKTGMDPDLALWHARYEAHRALKTFFSVLDNAPEWEKALNQIIPFFTYTYKNALMGLRILYEAPWIAAAGIRLGRHIEQANRLNWERHHPGEPFPENYDAQKIWIFGGAEGDMPYQIDLGIFSDWTRAMKNLADPDAELVGVNGFLRAPHPWQTSWLGLFTGQETAWGAPPDIKNVSPWFEFFDMLLGDDPQAFNANDPKSKDAVQWLSQILFFKAFGRIPPVATKIQTFRGLLAVDRDKAFAYYEANPDIRAYFQLRGMREESIWDTRKWSWHSFASEAEIDEYNRAMAGLDALNATYDEKAEAYYLSPWSREARDLKWERRAVVAQYIRDHPILEEAWMWTDPKKWAEGLGDWHTDMAVEDFFSIAAPVKADYDSDVAYQRAWLDYLRRRERFLDQHPDVYDRLYNQGTAIERAWGQHELQWAEILENQAQIRIDIAREEAKQDPNRAKLEVLYALSDNNYARLDAEAWGEFYDLIGSDLIDNQPGLVRDVINRGLGRIRELVALPGRSDYFYEIATDREREQIVVDEKYYASLGQMMDQLKAKDDFSTFWDELRRRGLLNRYLRENPSKRIDFAYSKDISRIFSAGPPIKFWDRLMAEPNVLRQYLRRNPEKVATYQRILEGRRYFNGLQAIWTRIGDDFGRFYDELAKNPWLQSQYFARHPEKAGGGGSAYAVSISALYAEARDGLDFFRRLQANPQLMAEYMRRHPDAAARYRAGQEYFRHLSRWVELLKASRFDEANAVWDAMPDWVRARYLREHPESRAGITGSAYASALGKWVDLLRAKKFVEADEYFRGLPDWIKERYFENHPDQRAKHELTTRMLRAGAEYFLAHADDKLRILQKYPELGAWLKEHGGDEAAWRGLIFAIYRSLPSSQAWLKRKFAEAYPELFGQEAQGQRRLQAVREQLAAHPEMMPFYEKAFALQLSVYQQQLRRSGTIPKPLQMDRKRRLRKRRKRRAARLHSSWSLHAELRRK